MLKKTSTYQFTQDAFNDLHAIKTYTIEVWGTEQSKKYLQKIQESIQILCTNPDMGKACVDIDNTTLRFPTGEHMLYYKLIKCTVTVYAVLHKTMLPVKHLPQRNEI